MRGEEGEAFGWLTGVGYAASSSATPSSVTSLSVSSSPAERVRKKAGKTRHDRVNVTSRGGGVIAAEPSGHCSSGKMSQRHDEVRPWDSDDHSDRSSECRRVCSQVCNSARSGH